MELRRRSDETLNRFFVFIYYLVGLIADILHPVSVEGMDRLPSGGVLLCPNHASDWDPVLVALKLPVNYRLHIMAKEELFRNPALGWILRKVGAFPVSRGNNDIQSVKTAMQAIKSGDNLLMFPEGTTVRNGVGYADCLPAHAHGGVGHDWNSHRGHSDPVFVNGEKKLFHRTRIIFGEPYQPQITGGTARRGDSNRSPTAFWRRPYALGGQTVGGKPLCE